MTVFKKCGPLSLSFSQVGGQWMGSVFSDLWDRPAAARSGLCLSAPEWYLHLHAGPVLHQRQTSQPAEVRGTPLPHRLGSLRVVQGLFLCTKMSIWQMILFVCFKQCCQGLNTLISNIAVQNLYIRIDAKSIQLYLQLLNYKCNQLDFIFIDYKYW